MKTTILSLLVSGFFLATSTAAEWVILPGEIELRGAESRQHLLFVERDGEAFTGEIADAEWVSDKPEIVKVVDGELIAVSNGTATVTARKDGKKISETVHVSGVGGDVEWSFNRHVLPVLTRQGCNMGACHGAVAGKGEFRLSLRGYDPPADHYWITKEARGRRIERAAPARSLLLTKPTMAASHKGGKRLDSDSREYRILAEWIADGGIAPDEAEAPIDRIEVAPDLSILKKGDRQRLIVTAHYKDGTSMDVTDWAKFASADEAIAMVDESGEVEIIGYGEGAVSALYSSNVALARFRSPFGSGLDPEIFSEAPRANFIDELVLTQLEQLQLKPSGRSSDGDFIRRAFLDTIGSLPKLAETRSFLADENPDKRTKIIDDLLQRPEFVDYWTYRWADVFLVNGQVLRPDAVKAYYQWIRSGVEKNLPWDDMARQVVTATGLSTEEGATNFYAVHQDPENMAENVSQAFLSLSINCAKCHDHPLEKWTNDQYYAFANLFSRVRAKGWGGDPRNGDGIRTVYVEPRGDLIQPRTGKPQIPAPLDGEPIDPEATEDRREALAAWLTDPENDYFSRSITNRVWAAFFGDGLVSPVDDLRASNPASNEPLLNALAAHLVKNEFNLKSLMRLILNSETYQRSGEVLSENLEDTKYHSRYYPRRLMAEVLYDAIIDVTGVPTVFGNVVLRDGSTQKTEFYEAGTKALQLYDSAVQSYFLKTFGRNEREITCECERSNQPSMVQALHLSNGDTLNEKLSDEKSIVASLIATGGSDSKMLEEAYLTTLTRMPTEDESARLVGLMKNSDAAEKQLILEDLFWALMTSREFLFQH
ncbi:MAG: DUF1549 and DUF1553 domain-containing protein [Verrucomicrobiales bacterium]|nr:DUF1549 and DUF1553 domain-containing protein [Verrucomicrobiales bacterium]